MVSAFVFSTPLWLALIECGVALMACVALCGMGVGLSAMLPRFIYENPAHRVSVWALILGFVGSVVYVFASGLLFAVVLLLASQHVDYAPGIHVLGVTLFAAISLLTAFAPMWVGVQRLERYQWEH
jgi:hypothetical protein